MTFSWKLKGMLLAILSIICFTVIIVVYFICATILIIYLLRLYSHFCVSEDQMEQIQEVDMDIEKQNSNFCEEVSAVSEKSDSGSKSIV